MNITILPSHTCCQSDFLAPIMFAITLPALYSGCQGLPGYQGGSPAYDFRCEQEVISAVAFRTHTTANRKYI